MTKAGQARRLVVMQQQTYQRVLIILLSVLCAPSPACGQSQTGGETKQTAPAPVVVPTIPERLGWYEIPETKLTAVCPRSTEQYDFRFHCHNVVDAWG